jgi:glycosyltransferase involved in cell wall biosynthesis
MRALLATAYFDSHRGGIEIVAGRMARELQQCGVAVTWLATDATPPVTGTDGGRPVSIAAWNMAERRLGVPLPLPGPAGVASIWREVKATDAVVLHDSLYPTNVVAMLAAQWHRKPVVLVQHIAAVPYNNFILRSLMRLANVLITRPMLAAADQVVFISDTVARHFSAVWFKAPPRLIFNGVDTDIFRLPAADFDKARVRASLGLPVKRNTVLFVGRFVEKKGLHIIEQLARYRPDLSFALAGWGQIDPAGWRLPNVHVFSDLQGPSLVSLYQASDLFVLPSVGEGLPLVLQEALACGLPVVCGRETAAADPAAHGLVEGVEIDGSDQNKSVAAFAASIDRMLTDASIRDHKMAADARHAYVLGRYSWTEAAKAHLGILNRLVEPSSAFVTGSLPHTPQDRA